MAVLTLLILILSGILVNLMSALFGIGGWVLMVPILRTVFPGLSLQMIAATSLTIVMGTSLINLILFRRQQINISMKNLLLWSGGMIVGVQIGFNLSFSLSDLFITLIFSLSLFILALKTLLRAKNREAVAEQSDHKEHIYGVVCCAFGGTVAGITGIGGGAIMAPLIGQLKSVKPNQIAVYTNYMMIIGGLGNLYGYLAKNAATPPPVFPDWQIGYVNFAIVGIVVFSSFLMSFFSMKLRGVLTVQTTSKLLAVILIGIASYMLLVQLNLWS